MLGQIGGLGLCTSVTSFPLSNTGTVAQNTILLSAFFQDSVVFNQESVLCRSIHRLSVIVSHDYVQPDLYLGHACLIDRQSQLWI